MLRAASGEAVMLPFIALGVSLAVLWRRLMYVLLQVLVLFPLFAVTDLFVRSRDSGIWAKGPDVGIECLAIFSLLALLIVGWKIGLSASVPEGPRVLAEAPQSVYLGR